MRAPRKAPGTPASGGAGRKLRNPFSPKKTNINPRRTRAITTIIFIDCLHLLVEYGRAKSTAGHLFLENFGRSPHLRIPTKVRWSKHRSPGPMLGRITGQ